MDNKYDNDMRGSLWAETERKNDKAPTMAGTLTVSGVELRIVMWPKRVAGGSGKRAGETFYPISVEYKQGTKFVLAKVNPSNIVVTGAVANAEPGGGDAPAAEAPVSDLPF